MYLRFWLASISRIVLIFITDGVWLLSVNGNGLVFD